MMNVVRRSGGLWNGRGGALMGIAVLAGILFMAAGCAKDGPASSPCEGFGGGNIVGKWKLRFPDPKPTIYEYRPDGTYREDHSGGKLVYEGTYEVDGNELRTFRRVDNATWRGNQCFSVQGSVLRKRDQRAAADTSDGYFDRI
jgi:hypothetical protein